MTACETSDSEFCIWGNVVYALTTPSFGHLSKEWESCKIPLQWRGGPEGDGVVLTLVF